MLIRVKLLTIAKMRCQDPRCVCEADVHVAEACLCLPCARNALQNALTDVNAYIKRGKPDGKAKLPT